MQTIYGVAQEITNTILDEGISCRGRGQIKPSVPDDDILLFGSTGARRLFQSEAIYRCEYKVWLKIPLDASTVDRLTSLNPISIGYELIPYSFVLDWVWNIGGYLRDLETAFLYDKYFRTGYQTLTWKHKGGYAIAPGGTTPSNVALAGSGRIDCRWKSRSVLTDYPAPSIPPVRVDLGSGRLLNLAALLGAKL